MSKKDIIEYLKTHLQKVDDIQEDEDVVMNTAYRLGYLKGVIEILINVINESEKEE